jgi:hypothetical protein
MGTSGLLVVYRFMLMKLKGKIFGNKEMRILMLGLDAAGKTSEYPSLSSCTPGPNVYWSACSTLELCMCMAYASFERARSGLFPSVGKRQETTSHVTVGCMEGWSEHGSGRA